MFLTVVLCLPFVEHLVRRVLVGRAKHGVLFGYRPVSEVGLQPVDRERTAEHDVLDSREPGCLEEVVHADDVELQCHVRRVLAAEHVGQVDRLLWADIEQEADHVVEPPQVAPREADTRLLIRRRWRDEIGADHVLAFCLEKVDQAPPDEAAPTEDHGSHAECLPVRPDRAALPRGTPGRRGFAYFDSMTSAI